MDFEDTTQHRIDTLAKRLQDLEFEYVIVVILEQFAGFLEEHKENTYACFWVAMFCYRNDPGLWDTVLDLMGEAGIPYREEAYKLMEHLADEVEKQHQEMLRRAARELPR